MGSAVPFSISDILERIVPGTIFLCLMALAFPSTINALPTNVSLPGLWFVFLASAYAVGVVLNNSYNLWRIKGSRDYWHEKDGLPEYKQAIQSAIRSHFRIDADEKSWAFCYGACTKHGYSPNTQLFQGLTVFCRSMMMAMLFASVAFLIGMGTEFCLTGTLTLSPLLFAAVSFALALAFRSGATAYDHAFVGSIYEGFYSWYCEAHPGAAQKTNLPGAV